MKQFKKEQEKLFKKCKKGKEIAAKNVLKKYKNMKKPKKTYLVKWPRDHWLQRTSRRPFFAGESILNAANKVLNFKQFKKKQETRTRKMLDSKALEKLENKNKQFMIEKIIQGVEFENASQSNPEKNPEIKTIESNYRIARRIYEQLFLNIAELFHEYIQSIDFYEQQEIEEDMKINGWGTVENIRTIKDSMRLLNLFQNFYTATGRLPTFNELLVVPDGDAQPEEKINLKQLYTACFKIQTPTLLFLYHFWDFYRWKKFASCQKCHNRIKRK